MHELILHSRLYLSSRRDFNDPFDSNFGLDISDDPETIAAYVQGIFARNPGLAEKSQQDFLNDVTRDPNGFRDRTYQRISDPVVR